MFAISKYFLFLNPVCSAEQTITFEKNQLEKSISNEESDGSELSDGSEFENYIASDLWYSINSSKSKKMEMSIAAKIWNSYTYDACDCDQFVKKGDCYCEDAKKEQYKEFLLCEFLIFWGSLEDKTDKSYEKNLSLILTFPFLESFEKDDIFELLRYSCYRNMPYKKNIDLMSKCFPCGKDKKSLERIIEKICQEGAELILSAENENKENYKLKLENIFLSFEFDALRIKKIVKLLLNRIEIIAKTSELMKEEIEKKESDIGKKNPRFNTDQKKEETRKQLIELEEHQKKIELYEKKIEEINCLRTKILKLNESIKAFHQRGFDFIISEKFFYTDLKEEDEKVDKFTKEEKLDISMEEDMKKKKMQEFKTLVKDKIETCKLLLVMHQEKKEQYNRLFGPSNEELIKNFQKEYENFIKINRKFFRVQSTMKILLTVNQTSKYFLAMNEKEFKDSLESLTPTELLGLSFFIYLGNLFAKYFTEKYKDKDGKKILMKKTTKRIKESNLDIAKKILRCVEKMESGDLYKKTKEDFLEIFKNKELKILENSSYWREDLLYWIAITNASINKDNESHKLLKIFPFLNLQYKGLLKSIAYGYATKEEISYDQIMEWIKDFSPYIVDGSEDIIYNACKRIANTRKEKETLKENNSESSAYWPDILLSLKTPFIGLKTIEELFVDRRKIMNKYGNLLISHKILEEKKAIPEFMYHKKQKEKYIKLIFQEENVSLFFQSLCNELEKKLLKNSSTDYKKDFAEIEKEMQKTLENSENYISRINLLELMKKSIESMKNVIAVSKELIKISEEEKENEENIKKEIFNIQSMKIVFFIMYKLSEYVKDKTIETFLTTLTKDQSIGLSVLIYVANTLNNFLLKNEENDVYKDLRNDRYIMGRFIEEIKQSESEDAKQVIKCANLITLDHSKTREDFLSIFQNNENKEVIGVLKHTQSLEEKKNNF